VDGEVSPTLREGESRTLPAARALSAAASARPKLATAIALVGLAAVSTLLRAVLVGWVHGPRVFMDELGYERMAQSFAHTGHFSLFGKSGLAYSPLYPIVLSPIYALTSSLHTAYELAKVENALLISLSVFPIYAIARFVLPRGRSIGVAALSLIAPLLLYSSFEMSESIAYPLFLVAIWAMLRAIRDPSLRNDALLLAAIALASAARLQQVALIPAALTAILLVALLRRDPPRGRLREVRDAISHHRLLFGIVAAALVAVLARMAMNGGNLPLAGRYANVGTAHASPLRVFELAVQHLAELDFAVGVVPFAAALLAGYALVRSGLPRRALVFASVAVASTVWLLLEVAYDAAAFDATSVHPRPGSGLVDLPRLHERYLIYVMPLFFVALVVALPLLRRKFPLRLHLAIAAVAAVLPLSIPFGTIINNTNGVDTFALQAFGKTVRGEVVPISHVALVVVILSAVLALGYVRAAAQPIPSLAVAVTVLVLIVLSGLELGLQTNRVSAAVRGLPAHNDWVDRVVGSDQRVALVGGDGVTRMALGETAFWNESIKRLYYTCRAAFGSDYGELPLTPAEAVHARYAVAPAALGVRGRVLSRDPEGKLVLLAPAQGALRVPLRCSS
jgi:Dolichyl-phosphate-mannose-protein mannosyltransferase